MVKRVPGIHPPLLCVLFVVHTAIAQPDSEREAYLEVSAGYGQSDNLGREVMEGVRSAFHWLGVAVDLGAERPRFSGSLAGDLQLREYGESELLMLADDNELLGSLDGYVAISVFPDVFTWSISANTGQTRSNPFEAASPLNREQVNVWSTGPRLDLPVGQRTVLRIDGQRRERSYEESDRLDSTSEQVDLGLRRVLSNVSTASVYFSRNTVSYETGVDYAFESAYVAYERSFSSGGVELQIGVNDVSGRQIDVGTTPFASLRWDRGIGRRSSLSLWATRELTDPGELFRTGGVPGADTVETERVLNDLDLGDARLDGVVLSQDPIKRTAVGLALSVQRERSSFSISLGATEEDYQGGLTVGVGNESLDNDSILAQFTADRRFARRWRGSFSIWAVDRSFDQDGRSNRDSTSRLSARRTLTNHGAVELLLQRNRRSGDIDPSDENLYAVSMSYGFGN